MGCNESRKPNKISFDDVVTQKLQRLFDKLKNRYSSTANTDHLCPEAFEYLTDGRPELGVKLYDFMLKHSTTKKVDFENFIPIVEILIEEPSSYHLQGYRALDKMEIFFLISIQRIDITDEDFKQSKVSYLEALQFLQDVEFISYKSGLALHSRQQSDEQVARSVLQAVYPSSSGSVDWWSLVLFFKQLLPHLTEQVKTYYQQLFLSSNPKIIPKFLKPSYLLSTQQYIYLSLGNAYLKSSSYVNLLWSNAQFGWNFESLFKQLMSFDGPTLLLLKFEGNDNQSIIGAFNKKKWIDVGTYQGNEECYLFQLTPQFKVFAAQRFKRQFASENDADTQNYAYLHYFDDKIVDINSYAPSGLGFGGANKKFRLWIDSLDMQKRSYVTPEDETYKKGSLINPVIKEYQLTYMEIWAINKEQDALSTQLLVEKAGYLESHYLRSQMRVHKEIISLMKDNLQMENKPDDSTAKRPSEGIRMSRKDKILDMVDSTVQPNYQHNARVTSTSLAKSRQFGSKSYIKQEEVIGAESGFANTVLVRGSAPIEPKEIDEFGFKNTQLIRGSYQE